MSWLGRSHRAPCYGGQRRPVTAARAGLGGRALYAAPVTPAGAGYAEQVAGEAAEVSVTGGIARSAADPGYLGAMTALIRRPRAEIAPGAIHVPAWLSVERQRQLVTACRQWARPPAGMRATRLPTGGMMSVQTVCLGWHWIPYRYSRTAEDVDGAPVKPFPGWLAELGRQAVADAESSLTDGGPGLTDAEPGPADGDPGPAAANPGPAADAGGYRPDVALINYYDDKAKMGMHADREERSLAPVVSLSLGSTCIFRFGNTRNRNRPWTDIELESGDLFVFGGPARLAYHGVPKTLPGTGRPDIGLDSGRLNITLRESGLGADA